jgi:hypothetical protein
MRRVVIESPYKGKTPGEIERNLRFLRACIRDCITRGESPYASHALLTQPGVLRDHVDEERKLGIEAGLLWKDVADATVVYIDLGVTNGMSYGIERAKLLGKRIEIRRLGEGWDSVSLYATSHWGQ